MAVKDFLPIGEAKITVEKEVREKPSLAELTTIESPGKPVPASELERPNKTAKKKRVNKPKTAEAKDITKKDCILIITEKPQSAQKIAMALGNPRQIKEGKVSYYEVSNKGDKILVASAVGHLFNLTYVKGQTGWPIFDLEWQPSYLKKSSAFTKAYLETIKKLSKRAKEFIIATDYDIEGEVIGWNVLRFICNQETAKRMKYSTLTKPELLASYENPMPTPDWGQAYAGESRHILDWLYGINLSRALMSAIKTQKSFKILSIGRVQGPALKIIVDREREIDSFKPEPFWQVFAIIKNHIFKTSTSSEVERIKDPEWIFKHPEDIFDKTQLEKFKNIKEAIAETKITEEKVTPPHPFDLTSLQRDAYALHRFSPSETLKVAQKLYLDGLISYPRTSSQKIPDAIQPKNILKALERHFPQLTKYATRKTPIEGKKSDPAHPSIYPTGEFASLPERELKLYTLILKRFISAFSPDAITENTRVLLESIPDKLKFTSSGLKIKEKGWTNVYPSAMEDRSIPILNGKVKIDEIKIEEKETQPPKRFTPTSLITILEKKNLGTKATRSMIVETLFDRGYLDGTSIKATPLGIKLIESLEKYSPIIIDEELTRSIEEQMDKIQESKSNFKEQEEQIIEKAKRVITDVSKEFKAKEFLIGKNIAEGLQEHREEQKANSEIMPCPVCKIGKLSIRYSKKTSRYFVACNRYPECKTTFSLPPNAMIKTTGKTSDSGLPILIALRKGKRPWEFPFNPNWREENQKQKEEEKEE